MIGVIPWIEELFPAEDSLSLFERNAKKPLSELTIAVIRLPRISNFTDFDPLEAEPTVTVKYISPKESLGHPDAVIIPGAKTAIADLLVIQKTGIAEEIKNYVTAGGTVIGICGGYQMLGEALADPDGLEGQEGRFSGLGLLPVKTVITPQKIVRQRQVTSNYPQSGLPVAGYEIHQGRTVVIDSPHINPLFDDPNLGVVDTNQAVWGTYLHGIFDNGAWRRAWLNRLRQQRGLHSLPTGIANYREDREATLDALADIVAANLDLKSIIM